MSNFFSSGKTVSVRFGSFSSKDEKQNFLVTESNMNNMVVSILIQLDSFTEAYITCEGKAFVSVQEKSVFPILFEEQLVFLRSLIFCTNI